MPATTSGCQFLKGSGESWGSRSLLQGVTVSPLIFVGRGRSEVIKIGHCRNVEAPDGGSLSRSFCLSFDRRL